MGQQPGSASPAGYMPPTPPPRPRPAMPPRSNVWSMTTPVIAGPSSGGHLFTPAQAPVYDIPPKNWIAKPTHIEGVYPTTGYTEGGGQAPPNTGQMSAANPSGATPNIRSRIETPARAAPELPKEPPPQQHAPYRYMQIPSSEAAMGGAAQAYPIPGSGDFYQPKPSDRHINHLLQNPHLADHFDQKFGQGAAAQHLNGSGGGWWNDPKYKDAGDYDYEGFERSGLKRDERGHWPDTFKTPGHITFSDESIYSGQPGGPVGGHWGDHKFSPSMHNLKNVPLEKMEEYFAREEPGYSVYVPVPPRRPKRGSNGGS